MIKCYKLICNRDIIVSKGIGHYLEDHIYIAIKIWNGYRIYSHDCDSSIDVYNLSNKDFRIVGHVFAKDRKHFNEVRNLAANTPKVIKKYEDLDRIDKGHVAVRLKNFDEEVICNYDPETKMLTPIPEASTGLNFKINEYDFDYLCRGIAYIRQVKKIWKRGLVK